MQHSICSHSGIGQCPQTLFCQNFKAATWQQCVPCHHCLPCTWPVYKSCLLHLPFLLKRHKHAHQDPPQNSRGQNRNDAEAWSTMACHCIYEAAAAPAKAPKHLQQQKNRDQKRKENLTLRYIDILKDSLDQEGNVRHKFCFACCQRIQCRNRKRCCTSNHAMQLVFCWGIRTVSLSRHIHILPEGWYSMHMHIYATCLPTTPRHIQNTGTPWWRAMHVVPSCHANAKTGATECTVMQ